MIHPSTKKPCQTEADCKPIARSSGKTAYEIAVEQGFKGSEIEWIKFQEGVNAELSKAQADRAQGLADNAEQFADAARNSAEEALHSENNAKASEVASKASELQSKEYEELSEASKNAALASEQAAKQSENTTDAYRLEAKAWASNPEDLEVSEGLYSAKHYSRKSDQRATDSENAAAASLLSANNSEVSAQNALDSEETSLTLRNESEIFNEQAGVSANAAHLSQTIAAQNEAKAVEEADKAENSALDAHNSEQLAKDHEQTSLAHANASAASANSSALSESAALASELTAEGHSNDASDSAQEAKGYRDTANDHRIAAETAQGASESARDVSISESTKATNEADRALSEANRAEGYADAMSGGMIFNGLWDASNNTLPDKPTVGSGQWKISEPGTLNGKTANAGDTLIYYSGGDEFLLLDTKDQVTSVNERIGNITGLAEASDISEVGYSGSYDDLINLPILSIDNWNTAYNWGDHSTEGYLKSVSWAQVSGKPTTFTPSSHTHTWDEVTSKPATATRWPTFSEVTGKPSSYTPSSHSHDYGDLPFSSGDVSNWNTAYGWGNHASAGYALASRTISAGTGLTGGGSLAANRTLSVDSTVLRTSGAQSKSAALNLGPEHGIPISSVNSTNSSPNRWNNNAVYAFAARASNNAMAFIVGGASNDRNGLIQVGHASSGYASAVGNLRLNTLGGNLTLGSSSSIVMLPSGEIHSSGTNSSSSYGSISIAGVKGNYVGIHFSSANLCFMSHSNGSRSGLYDMAAASWKWYFDGDGALGEGTVPWGRVTGTPALVPTSRTISAGKHLTGGGNLTANRTITFDPEVQTWITDSQGNNRLYFGNGSNTTNGMLFQLSSSGAFRFRNSSNADIVTFTSGGAITAVSNITAYSDRRIKKNIKKIDFALDKVKSISGYTFDRTDQETPRQTGVIAQEVQKVLPEVVIENDDGTLSVAYGNMVGLLIEAIKEQQKQIDALKPWYKKLYEWIKEKF